MAIGSERQARGLGWPTALTVAALAVLIGLGTWQLERRAWKEGLLDRIRVRAHTEPMVLDAAVMLFGAGQDLEYTRVRARGRLLNDRALFYFAQEKEGPGLHVYVPLQTPGGVLLLVNRGFIREGQRLAFVQSAVAPAAEAEIVGLLRRPGSKGAFSPENDVGRNLWYWRDLSGMAKAAGAADAKSVLPFFLDALAASDQAAAKEQKNLAVPRAGVTRLELPNRHLEYALTWYGLAGALTVVYLIYAAKWQRSRRQRWILGATRRRSWGNP